MLQIDRTLISLDVIEKKFICDLSACKGDCCLEGDSGAPLENEETKILDNIYPIIKKHLSREGIKAIKRQGKWVIDKDYDKVTPLIENKECAYAFFDEQNVLSCAIEKAYFNKEIAFRKPISCHLYPIRITEYKNYDALNYEANSLCSAACVLGEKHSVEVYKFLKDPLIRKYGAEWYKELEIAVEMIKKEN